MKKKNKKKQAIDEHVFFRIRAYIEVFQYHIYPAVRQGFSLLE